jgi:hypothetical protein
LHLWSVCEENLIWYEDCLLRKTHQGGNHQQLHQLDQPQKVIDQWMYRKCLIIGSLHGGLGQIQLVTLKVWVVLYSLIVLGINDPSQAAKYVQ